MKEEKEELCYVGGRNPCTGKAEAILVCQDEDGLRALGELRTADIDQDSKTWKTEEEAIKWARKQWICNP